MSSANDLFITRYALLHIFAHIAKCHFRFDKSNIITLGLTSGLKVPSKCSVRILIKVEMLNHLWLGYYLVRTCV